MCSAFGNRITTVIAALALVLLRLSVKGDSGFHCLHIEAEKECNCGGHVIKTLTLWTEVQCADSCLRLDFCDTYIFDQKVSNLIGNCTLLRASIDHPISAYGNAHEFQGCKTLRQVSGKNLRNYLLGTENCPELTKLRKPENQVMKTVLSSDKRQEEEKIQKSNYQQ